MMKKSGAARKFPDKSVIKVKIGVGSALLGICVGSRVVSIQKIRSYS